MSNWMKRSLEEIQSIGEVEVISVINVLPRVRNLLFSGRDRKWLRSALGISTFSEKKNHFIPMKHIRVFGNPASLSWRLLPRLIWLQLILPLRAFLRTRKFDLVFSHGTYPIGMSALQVSKSLKIPCIIFNHEGIKVYREHFRPSAVKEILSALDNANAVAVLSHSHLKELKEFFPAKEAFVVPLGIDVAPGIQPKRRISTFKVISASRLDGREKEVHTLVSAVASAVNVHKIDITLTVAGDGFELQRLKRLAAKLRIEDRVRFTGWLDPHQLLDLFKEHHAFVCPSRHETFSYASLEAASCGIPVIGLRNVGMLSHFVDRFPKETALESLSSKSICEKLLLLFSNETRRMEIAGETIDIVLEMFTWVKHREALEMMVTAILAGHSSEQELVQRGNEA
jgi:glycosyltransferase involved in cell wall biosynthesis